MIAENSPIGIIICIIGTFVTVGYGFVTKEKCVNRNNVKSKKPIYSLLLFCYFDINDNTSSYTPGFATNTLLFSTIESGVPENVVTLPPTSSTIICPRQNPMVIILALHMHRFFRLQRIPSLMLHSRMISYLLLS